jgi:outer membrane biosynthesis protein TonB/pSer/pThr/pTyr-binding forkhead associated (FHA) protein
MKQAALLSVFTENEEAKEALLGVVDSEAVIGTSEAASIKIDDWRCSGIHALIKRQEDGSFRVIDLGSTYGTFHSHKSINQVDLKEGDSFFVGHHELVIKLLDQEQLNKYSSYEIKPERTHKEAGIDLSTQRTVLEVSLFWGEKLLEVKQFRRGQKITIGNPKLSTFGIPEEFLPDDSQEGVFELATYQGSQLKLSLPRMAQGLLWTDGKVLNLDTLRLYQNSEISSKTAAVKLLIGDRAHLEFGELIFVFRFIHPAKKIRTSLIPKFDKQIGRIILGILAFYSLILLVVALSPEEKKVTTIEDIPKHLKKVVYDIGIKAAKEKQKSAIGEIAKAEGGRARAEEGKASAKKDLAEKSQEKVESKEAVKPAAQKSKTPITVQADKAVKKEAIDFDKSFSEAAPSEMTAVSAMVSNVKVNGTSASAIANGGFARGSKGLGAGGGGTSVGVGALKGNGIGGGMGAGDYGLNPSKGKEIKLPSEEDVEVMGGLDPDVIARIIKRYLPQIQYCYEQQLVSKPHLKGKVAVAFVITGNGSVAKERVTETTLKDSPTEACILGKVKNWKFPKPLGGGTVGVNYPFILMSNNSK